MDWFLIFVSVAVVWLASICKILHASFYPYQSSFANNDAGSLHKRNVLLVIAHPDDESMFFSPTINQLTSRGHNIHILCMSTGNADGIGDVRKEELYRASAILKVPLQQVTVLDHPDFQDGFGKVWNSTILSNIVEKKVLDHAIDMIITFDNYGVSGHCNHRDVHQGVQRFMLATSQREIEAWELVSTNIVRKYSGPIDIWLSFWSAQRSLNGQMHCLLNEHPLRSYLAMSQHLSQWVHLDKSLDYILDNLEIKFRPSENKPGHRMLTPGPEPGVDGIFHHISLGLCQYATTLVVVNIIFRVKKIILSRF